MIKSLLSPLVKVGTDIAFGFLLTAAAVLEYIEEKLSDDDEE